MPRRYVLFLLPGLNPSSMALRAIVHNIGWQSAGYVLRWLVLSEAVTYRNRGWVIQHNDIGGGDKCDQGSGLYQV